MTVEMREDEIFAHIEINYKRNHSQTRLTTYNSSQEILVKVQVF